MAPLVTILLSGSYPNSQTKLSKGPLECGHQTAVPAPTPQVLLLSLSDHPMFQGHYFAQTVFLLPRKILAPSPTDEIRYPPKLSLNVT